MAIQLNNIDLSNLEAKSLFITGGTGFFGFWLLNTLKNLNDAGAGIEVMLLSRDPEKFLQKSQVAPLDGGRCRQLHGPPNKI